MEAGSIDDELEALRTFVERLSDERGDGHGSANVPARPPDVPPHLQGGLALPLPGSDRSLGDPERARSPAYVSLPGSCGLGGKGLDFGPECVDELGDLGVDPRWFTVADHQPEE